MWADTTSSSAAESLWLQNLHLGLFAGLTDHPELEDVRNDLGLTKAFEDIRTGKIDMLMHELELNPGCCLLRDRFGATLLHWTAMYADVETMQILAEASVKNLYMDQAYVDMWWTHFIDKNYTFTGKWAPLEVKIAAFQELLNSIKPSTTPFSAHRRTLRIPGAFPPDPDIDSGGNGE